jgi:putative addiction module killer protein
LTVRPSSFILDGVIDVRRTPEFIAWLRDVRDIRARDRIAVRLARLEYGLLGDAKFFDGIGEIRVDYGPGYRVYLVRRGETLIILLCGGVKRSQQRDIRRAKALAERY